jgi:outer membrane protein assembly factor BamC
VLGEPFDRSWRRVGLALDRAHIKVTDKDRSKGVYFVQPAPDKKKDKDKKSADYLVTVSEIGGVSSIAVADQNGKSDADSERLLEVLLQGLNQENAPGDEVRPAR